MRLISFRVISPRTASVSFELGDHYYWIRWAWRAGPRLWLLRCKTTAAQRRDEARRVLVIWAKHQAGLLSTDQAAREYFGD